MTDDSPGVSPGAGGDAAGREPTHLPFGTAGGLKYDGKFESVMCSCANGVKTDHRCRVEMADGPYTYTDRGDDFRICGRTICANCIIDDCRDRCFEHDGDDDNDAGGSGGSGGGSDTGTTTNSTNGSTETQPPSDPTEPTATVRAVDIDPKDKTRSVYDFDAALLTPTKYYDPNLDNPIVIFTMAFGTEYEIDAEKDDNFKSFIGNDTGKSYLYGKKDILPMSQLNHPRRECCRRAKLNGKTKPKCSNWNSDKLKQYLKDNPPPSERPILTALFTQLLQRLQDQQSFSTNKRMFSQLRMIHVLLDPRIRDLMMTRDDQLGQREIDAGLAKQLPKYYERAAELYNGDTEYTSMVLSELGPPFDKANPLLPDKSKTVDAKDVKKALQDVKNGICTLTANFTRSGNGEGNRGNAGRSIEEEADLTGVDDNDLKTFVDQGNLDLQVIYEFRLIHSIDPNLLDNIKAALDASAAATMGNTPSTYNDGSSSSNGGGSSSRSGRKRGDSSAIGEVVDMMKSSQAMAKVDQLILKKSARGEEMERLQNQLRAERTQAMEATGKLKEARKAYKEKKARIKAAATEGSDDDSVSSTLKDYKDDFNLAKRVRDQAMENIESLESEIEQYKITMQKEEAADKARIDALHRADAMRPRHDHGQPRSSDRHEVKLRLLDIIQRYEETHGKHQAPALEDLYKEMNVSESDRAAINAIKNSLSDLENEGEIGISRHDAGYDIYYPITEDMEDGEETLDISSSATDGAVQRSIEEGEEDMEDL